MEFIQSSKQFNKCQFDSCSQRNVLTSALANLLWSIPMQVYQASWAAWAITHLHNWATVNIENKAKLENQFKRYVLNSKISPIPSIETLIILIFFFPLKKKTVMKKGQTDLKVKLQVLTMWSSAKFSQGEKCWFQFVSLLEMKSLSLSADP